MVILPQKLRNQFLELENLYPKILLTLDLDINKKQAANKIPWIVAWESENFMPSK